jgi:general stress protein 26
MRSPVSPGRRVVTTVDSMTGSLGELRALLDGMQIGFLTTLGAEGYFHSRPMQLQRHDADGTLWFATSLDSHKCEDLRANPRCCAAFLRRSKYVSVSGTAELVKDERLIRSMWRAAWRGWFPEGPKEPDLVLLKVVPEYVEYVDPPGGTLRSLYTRVKNAITRSRAEPAPKKQLELGHSH